MMDPWGGPVRPPKPEPTPEDNQRRTEMFNEAQKRLYAAKGQDYDPAKDPDISNDLMGGARAGWLRGHIFKI